MVSNMLPFVIGGHCIMSIEITFLGHSGFVLTSGAHAIAIDPFLTGNPVATAKAADIRCQYVALTHGHPDHMGDTAAIAKANVVRSLRSAAAVFADGMDR